MSRIISLCLLMLSTSVIATVDVNLSELEYLSDHLTPDECRQLVAALHTRSYKLNARFADSVRKVPHDVSCLNMLVHWNSRAGEGKGETHSMLSHRLKQIDRSDLATWLSKTSFHQLAEDLGNTLLKEPVEQPDRVPVRHPRLADDSRAKNPCPVGKSPQLTQLPDRPMDKPCTDAANDTESEAKSGASFWDMLSDTSDENYMWNMMDLIGFVLLAFLAVAALGAIVWCLLVHGCRGRKDNDDIEGCACSHSMGMPGEDSQGPPDSSQGQGYGKKKKDKKKKKEKQSSMKSMVCKTVEYRTDGTVEETQLMLSDASETDFNHAVDIVAGRRQETDLQQEPPPPPRNSKRRRMEEAGRQEHDAGMSQIYDRRQAVDGRSDVYEMQETSHRGPGCCEELRGSDGRRRTSDNQNPNNDKRHGRDRRWSDERRDGDLSLDPCWDCNQ